ncbi:MAG: hypothetical protein Q7J73_05005, partial [Dehalococcoidales bacterium]|nr:hypothetical protein [Dehalococcoidales bacterium]
MRFLPFKFSIGIFAVGFLAVFLLFVKSDSALATSGDNGSLTVTSAPSIVGPSGGFSVQLQICNTTDSDRFASVDASVDRDGTISPSSASYSVGAGDCRTETFSGTAPSAATNNCPQGFNTFRVNFDSSNGFGNAQTTIQLWAEVGLTVNNNTSDTIHVTVTGTNFGGATGQTFNVLPGGANGIDSVWQVNCQTYPNISITISVAGRGSFTGYSTTQNGCHQQVSITVNPPGSTPTPTSVPTAPPTLPLPTCSISAAPNPTSAFGNYQTTISWNSTNASSCSVSPGGWTGTSGSQTTTVTSDTTFTANCTGAGGSGSCQVPVTSTGQGQGSCPYGQCSALEYNNPFANRCSGTGAYQICTIDTASNQYCWSAPLACPAGQTCSGGACSGGGGTPPVSPPTGGLLSCSPGSQHARQDEIVSFSASGGNGKYSWSGGGSPPTGSGPSFSTSFSYSGTKAVMLSSGTPSNKVSTACMVTVGSEYDPRCVGPVTWSQCGRNACNPSAPPNCNYNNLYVYAECN